MISGRIEPAPTHARIVGLQRDLPGLLAGGTPPAAQQ
jgi:hypothetical protein